MFRGSHIYLGLQMRKAIHKQVSFQLMKKLIYQGYEAQLLNEPVLNMAKLHSFRLANWLTNKFVKMLPSRLFNKLIYVMTHFNCKFTSYSHLTSR